MTSKKPEVNEESNPLSELYKSMLANKPTDIGTHFDTLVREKINTKVDSIKSGIANQYFQTGEE